jgi:hypothetical protein
VVLDGYPLACPVPASLRVAILNSDPQLTRKIFVHGVVL